MYEGKKPRRARQRRADRIRLESNARSRRGPIETLRLRHDPRGTAKSERGAAGEIQSKVHGVNPWRAGKPKRGASFGKRLNPVLKPRACPGLQSLHPNALSSAVVGWAVKRASARCQRRELLGAARLRGASRRRRSRRPLRTAAMQSGVRQTEGLQLAARSTAAPRNPAQAGEQVAHPSRTGEGTFRSGVSAWPSDLKSSDSEFPGPAGRT